MLGLSNQLTVFVLTIFLGFIALSAQATPLDDYVNKPDPTYSYQLVSQWKGLGYTAYAINLTSQTWLTAEESSQPVWYHWLTVCIPDQVLPFHTSAIYIDGGGTTQRVPSELSPEVQILCVSSQTVVAHLGQIPPQPIVFKGDPTQKRRSEDAIIAYTWAHFINNTNEPEWLLRLPMTKAVVRAMDTIQSFTVNMPNVPTIQNFVIAGASKRGWTTWTTGAVDKRVSGMIPIVMPILNMVPNINQMYQVYGEWSFALQDYVDMNIMNYLNTPQFQALADVVDPIVYNSRFTMPKYAIVAAGDEFFLPTSPDFFWDQLTGPKSLRIVPDAEHSLIGQQIDVILTADTFYHIILYNLTPPEWSWKLIRSNTSASIIATIPPQKDCKLVGVYMWQANTLSNTKRDFRLLTCPSVECINPVIWTYKTLNATEDGVYKATVDRPWWGWAGFLIEAVFQYNWPYDKLNPSREIRLTTQVNVVPDTLPFPPCGNRCQPPKSMNKH